MAVDLNRTSGSISLPVGVANDILAGMVEDSFFMKVARGITIPGTGVALNAITAEPEAGWVGETDEKPVATHTLAPKTLKPYTLAVIEPFSRQLMRDMDALYEECVNRLPYALARKFDATIMGTTAPGTDFDVLGSCTKQDIATAPYTGFTAADTAIAAADGVITNIGLAPAGRSIVLGAVDSTGRPLFIPDVTQGSIGSIIGAPVDVAKALKVAGTPNIIGIAGDFSQAIYGTVAGVEMSVSDQATITASDTAINLWQRNMVAVRYEIEIGFRVGDTSKFVLLTDNATA